MNKPTVMSSECVRFLQPPTSRSDEFGPGEALIEAATEPKLADLSRSDSEHQRRGQETIERDALPQASVQLARTNAELEPRLADHLHDDKALSEDAAALELEYTKSELAGRLAQRNAEGDHALQAAQRREAKAIDERDAHAEARTTLAHTNAKLERCLADRSDDDKVRAGSATVDALERANAELVQCLGRRIVEGDEAAQEADRLRTLNQELERRDEVSQDFAQQQKLESMNDITWGLVELTRTDNEHVKTANADYEARLKEQIGQRLEHFDGGPRTLDDNPARRNSLDRIWGNAGSV